jgi:hypothetical protein
MKVINIVDQEGRPLIKIKNGRILISRFDGMDESTKKIILDLYKEIHDEKNDLIHIEKFLDYVDEETSFCS